MYTFLKTPKREKNHENTDSLLYEYFVGNILNTFTRTPNLVKTLNLLYTQSDDYFEAINTDGKLKQAHLKHFQSINNTPITYFFDKLEYILLETVFLTNSTNLFQMLKEPYDFFFYQTELWKILFQLYAFLRIHQNIFTHYDLHLNNIMLIKIPNKKLQFVYDDGVKQISFQTMYLIKIIDYGRVFLREHTDSFVKNMTQKDKKNRAFSFLVQILYLFYQIDCIYVALV
jgi:hypothetical protein